MTKKKNPTFEDYKAGSAGAKYMAAKELSQETGHILYRLCIECGEYPADDPSPLCPGCEAYKDHTAIY